MSVICFDFSLGIRYLFEDIRMHSNFKPKILRYLFTKQQFMAKSII